MLPPKVIIRFFLLVAVIAAVLLTRWPGVQEGYATCFRWGNNVFFARFWFWSEGTVGFLDPNDPSAAARLSPEARAMVPPAVGVRDTVMVLENRRVPGAVGFLRTSSRYLGYVPAAVLIALVSATPVRWTRRLRALLWGLLLVHAFILARVTLPLLKLFGDEEKQYALFSLSPFWMKMLAHLDAVFHQDPTVSFVLPTFIWFMLLFRPSQWELDQQPSQGKTMAAEP